jgi:hypothetical protein
VILAGLDVDAVARTYFFDRSSLALDETDSLGTENRLAERVAVPGRTRSGRDNSAHDPRGRQRLAEEVAALRTQAGRTPFDRDLSDLVGELTLRYERLAMTADPGVEIFAYVSDT